ncbi:hypothetical protein CASFOL_015423 [Castilleja foliolosa]|uniref:Protein gar2 n=1 Tax=Castilleja foliolosa TaxID=1961234 RepID=A0ABD3DDM6_9LAMI
MVLSNKRLKQKLRADKAVIIVASEAQNKSTDKNSLRTILNPGVQKPKVSKREKRRQTVKENPDIIKKGETTGDAEAKKQIGLKSDKEKVKKNEEKKRKRDENDASEDVKEKKLKQMKKNKKKQKKKKSKKKAENGVIKEQGIDQSWTGSATGEQIVKMNIESNEREIAEVPDKVYVGGIPYYSTEDDIRSYFESCGTITALDCMTFPDTGKFRGIAIITFKTEAAAKRALALDGSDMGGLFLKIQPFKSSKVTKSPNFFPSVMEGYNRIYVGNLSWDVTEDDLRKLFTNCTIESVRFGEDKETGEFKGYAHVDFSDTVSLNTALKLDQKILCGRPVRISCAVAKKGAVTNIKSGPKDNKVQSSNYASEVNEVQVTASKEANVVVSSEVNITSEANNPVTAKIRRRTCYECGERGHISSLCPKIKADDSTNQGKEVGDLEGYTHVDFGNNTALKWDALPKKETVTNFKPAPRDYRVQSSYNFTAVNEIEVTASGEANPVSSSKIRRRTCYECGERGHISSLCPKINADDSTNPGKETGELKGYTHVDFGNNTPLKLDALPKKETVTNLKPAPRDYRVQTNNVTAVNEIQVSASTEANPVSSSKIRRRTCYECGERGHISSLCPKIKGTDSTSAGAAA